MNKIEQGKMGYKLSRPKQLARFSRIRDEYNNNPNVCKRCNKPFSFEKRKNIFCSLSCRSTYNMNKRYNVKPNSTEKERRRDSNQKARIEALVHYSRGTLKCVCCGELNTDFLTLDHINMDGAKNRKELSNSNNNSKAWSGATFSKWLKRHNYPEDIKLQVLCFNCNCGRQRYNGICPHKIIK